MSRYPPPPRNYTALPTGPVRRGPRDVRHDQRLPGLLSGVLLLRLEALDPLHVGTGGLAPVRRGGGGVALALDLVTQNNAAAIPGSSLKGLARSTYEALAGGCDLHGSCNPRCTACLLFGYVERQQTFAGRVGFEDALAIKPHTVPTVAAPLPQAFQPRRAVGRRVYGPPVQGRATPVRALAAPAGTRFLSRMTLRNVSPQELGLVLLGLGVDGSFAPRVGGGRYHGLGRVAITVRRARLREGRQVRPETLRQDRLARQVEAWLEAAEPTSNGREALTVLRNPGGSR
ncbi:MAG: hypothetical protein H6739_35795 [Alphaproteobacteria bacterium]|nr:hypothetical protein [Alphaproteobacteria bacterium]